MNKSHKPSRGHISQSLTLRPFCDRMLLEVIEMQQTVNTTGTQPKYKRGSLHKGLQDYILGVSAQQLRTVIYSLIKPLDEDSLANIMQHDLREAMERKDFVFLRQTPDGAYQEVPCEEQEPLTLIIACIKKVSI